MFCRFISGKGGVTVFKFFTGFFEHSEVIVLYFGKVVCLGNELSAFFCQTRYLVEAKFI